MKQTGTEIPTSEQKTSTTAHQMGMETSTVVQAELEATMAGLVELYIPIVEQMELKSTTEEQ